jgi:hypothetical protein
VATSRLVVGQREHERFGDAGRATYRAFCIPKPWS